MANVETKRVQDEFTSKWGEYINGLSAISWNLPNVEDRDEIRTLQASLFKLVEKAAPKVS